MEKEWLNRAFEILDADGEFERIADANNKTLAETREFFRSNATELKAAAQLTGVWGAIAEEERRKVNEPTREELLAMPAEQRAEFMQRQRGIPFEEGYAASALMPETAATIATRGELRPLADIGQDLATGTGRALASVPSMDPAEMGRTSGQPGGTWLGDVIRSRELGSAMIGGGLVGPVAAGMGAARGVALRGLASGGAELATDPEELTAGRAALTMGGALAGEAVGPAMKALSGKVMSGAVKPSKKLRDLGYSGEEILTEGYGSYKGLKGSAQKIADRMEELGDAYDDVLTARAGQTISGKEAIESTIDNVLNDIGSGKFFAESDALYAKLDDYAKKMEDLTGPTGEIDLQKLLNVRRSLQKASKWDSPLSAKDMKADAIVARELYVRINDLLARNFPEVRTLDAEMSKLYPLQQMATEAVGRRGNWDAISLSDKVAMAPAVVSGGADAMTRAGMLAAVGRAGKSPTVATGLRQLSGMVPPGAGAGAVGSGGVPIPGIESDWQKRRRLEEEHARRLGL